MAETAEALTPDLCVIGAGAAGLSVAAAAAMLQASVMLIEKGAMGGECLNAGCVPSKALLAAARHADAVRRAAAFGIGAGEPKPAFNRVNAHVRSVIEAIAPMDSEQRYRALGATVIRAEARFVDRRTVAAGDRLIRARRFVVATGSRPAIPPIPGLDRVPYLTNESLFDLTRRPRRLAILGGGPTGLEMAQAHARLGSEVVVIEPETLLAGADPEAARLVRLALERDGVRFILGAAVRSVAGEGERLTLAVGRDGAEETIEASHILVAAGRRPSLEGLDLAKAGVAVTAEGVAVDRKLRSSNRRVYAIGDAAGPPRSTHGANHQAGLVIRHALFRLPVRADAAPIPRVVYTDPEIAAVGLSEAEARRQGRGVRALRSPFAENDRARAERRTDGFIKAMVDGRGRILGVTIVGAQAGELLAPWTLAMANGLRIEALASLVHPYPTLSEASKRAATAFLLPKLRSPWLRRALGLLRRLG